MARSKRLALSIPTELDQILEDMSQLQGQAKSQIILEILKEVQPYLSQVRDALKAVKESQNPADVVRTFGSAAVMQALEQTSNLSKEVHNFNLKLELEK